MANLRLLTFFYVLALGLARQALAADQPTVAVLDFVSPDGPVDSVLFGAADLLEAELGRYELRVISRRELGMLLGERGLARSGFTRIEDFQGGTLPWADFLLRCKFGAPDGSKPRASLHLVNAQTGREVKAWNLAATRPMDALKEVARYVPQVVSAILQRTVEERPPQPMPGFTTVPEAAQTFYLALDHLVRGQAEYAAEYFRVAAKADTNFTFAVLGQAKSYEHLGLPGVAEALRATLPARDLGTIQAPGTGSALTVRFVNRGGEFTAKNMQRVRDVLQTVHGFSLFEPDWIPALSREKDLKLTGEFPLIHGLDSRLWLRAEYMLVFTAGEEALLRVSAIDLVRGRLLGSLTGRSNDLDELCRGATAIIRRPAVAPSGVAAPPNVSTNLSAVKLDFTYSIDEVAFALRQLAGNPRDLACWVHLLSVMWMEQLHPDVVRAHLDAVDAVVPPDAPDAVDWLAWSLWFRYRLDALEAEDLPDIEKAFAPLLERYPESLQAQVIRFHIARFLYARGELKRSRELAQEIAEKVAPRVLKMSTFIPMDGHYVEGVKQVNYAAFPAVIDPVGPRMGMLARDMFALASCLCALDGDWEGARKFLDQARPLAWLSEVSPIHHLGGPVAVYPVSIGVWQPFVAKARVEVGWTFLPIAADKLGDKPMTRAMKSTEEMLRIARETLEGAEIDPVSTSDDPGNVSREVASREDPHHETVSLSETWREYIIRIGGEADDLWYSWLNVQTAEGDAFDSIRTFRLGLSAFSEACTEVERKSETALAEFAVRSMQELRSVAPHLVKTHGEIGTGRLALQCYWFAAHACLKADVPAEAWALTRQALAWRGKDESKLNISYAAALAAWRTGNRAEAANILRTLAENPRSKELRLVLPGKARLPSLYEESLALLEKVRAGAAPNGIVQAIDLTPEEPYYFEGAFPEHKRLRTLGRRSEEDGAEVLAEWQSSMRQAGIVVHFADLNHANYEDWPDERLAQQLPRPRFGDPYTHMLCDIDKVGIEFVWIDSMQIWATRYELTEDAYYYLMTERETGEQLPQALAYNQAKDVCDMLNERDKGRLPGGYCYRIPTVSEWEALARCGTNRIYPWGHEMPPTLGNYAELADRKGTGPGGYHDIYQGLAPVEESGRNEWDLYGMGGNMQEWTTSPDGKPVVKGGSNWTSHEKSMRIDDGFDSIPPDAGYDATLRCVLAPELLSSEARTAE